MNRKANRILAGFAAFVMLLTLSACGIGGNPEETTAPTTEPTTQSTTAPTTDLATLPTAPTMPTVIFTDGELNLEQLRMSGYRPGWLDFFHGIYGDSHAVTSVAELKDAANRLEITTPEGYDADFFNRYFLVLIPMQSGSGSVRYEASAVQENGVLTISVHGTLSGIGTSDMADWLLLVMMPRSQYRPDGRITVSGGSGVTQDPTMNTSDR